MFLYGTVKDSCTFVCLEPQGVLFEGLYAQHFLVGPGSLFQYYGAKESCIAT